eukprot:6374252-Amphidinium_carterae.1
MFIPTFTDSNIFSFLILGSNLGSSHESSGTLYPATLVRVLPLIVHGEEYHFASTCLPTSEAWFFHQLPPVLLRAGPSVAKKKKKKKRKKGEQY